MSLNKALITAWVVAVLNTTNPALAQETTTQTINTRESVWLIVNNWQSQDAQIEAPRVQESKSALKIARALDWESVWTFMRRAYQVKTWYELLVRKDNWDRVINPETDLMAWKEYVLARNETEATNLSKIFSKKSKVEKKEVVKNKFEPIKLASSDLSNMTFDFSSYLKSISIPESSWKYTADNSKIWKKLWISSSKHAKWKYQFSHETLATFGYKTEKQRREFLKNPELQEQKMKEYTNWHLEYLYNSPSLSTLKNEWLSLPEILATMHHRWAAWAEWVAKRVEKNVSKYDSYRDAFYDRLDKIKWDWLKTKTSDYVKVVSSNYVNLAMSETISEENLSRLNAKSNVVVAQTEIKSEDNNLQLTLNQEVISQRTSNEDLVEAKEEPILVPTIAANDQSYDLKMDTKLSDASLELLKNNNEEKAVPVKLQEEKVVNEVVKEAHVEANNIPLIELKQETSIAPITQFIKEYYKKEVLSKIASDESLSKDFRTSLVAKLSKVDDLKAYYQNQIDYYKDILENSKDELAKQRAKRILPWLTTLMKDSAKIMVAANEQYKTLKKAA